MVFDEPSNLYLDITRLFSRRGQADTGIDRVERGYLGVLRNRGAHFLIQTQYPNRLWEISNDNVEELISTASEKQGYLRIFENYRLLKKYAIKASPLRRPHLKKGDIYFNIGHTKAQYSNFYKALRSEGVKICTFVHDIIPIDYPEFTRKDKIEDFQIRFDSWCEFSDLIISPSEYTAERIFAVSQRKALVAPLAVDVPKLPHTEVENAYCVISTIEPRKNHMMLLNVWVRLFDDLGVDCPELWLIGKRGWGNHNVFEFLDNHELMGKKIKEFGDIDDAKMLNLIEKSKAILFPSHIEGFGLPFHESLCYSKPIIASNLQVFSEWIDDTSLFLDPNDENGWFEAIKKEDYYKGVPTTYKNWEEHVNQVIKGLGLTKIKNVKYRQ